VFSSVFGLAPSVAIAALEAQEAGTGVARSITLSTG